MPKTNPEEVKEYFLDYFMVDKPEYLIIITFCDYLVENKLYIKLSNNSLKMWVQKSSDRIQPTNVKVILIQNVYHQHPYIF